MQFLYNAAKTALLNNSLDLLSDTFNVALMTDNYIPDRDADVYFGDINADEASGTGYTAGGKTLTGKVITQDDANDRAAFDATDPVWTLLTTSTNAAVIYKATGSPATSPLLAYIEFDQLYTPNGADFTIEWDANGIFTLGE